MPFLVKCIVSISSSHFLPEYDGQCRKVHGHNWRITVTCGCDLKDLHEGMVTDFSKIKQIIKELDHESLNNFIEYPTAENIAHYLYGRIPKCVRIEVEETEGNVAIYEDPHGRGV